LLAVAVGLFCSWATLQSFGSAHGWTIGPALTIAVVAFEVASAFAVSLTEVPGRFARASAEFWEGGALTRLVVVASFYACASIASGTALVLIFGTRSTST
jgi:hypothetical protein